MADIGSRNLAADPAWRGANSCEVVKRISWSAVWAGLMAALGMEALFTLFGLFIGFGMYNWKAANPWSGISAWTTVWYLVTAGWSMYFGAWCAARLSGSPVREIGILHGITTWGFAAAVTLAVITVGSWAVLREGIDVLRTATIASAQVAPTAAAEAPARAAQAANAAAHVAGQVQQSAGPMAQATADIISGLALRIWGGVLLGLITAVIGGLLGRTHAIEIGARQAPPAPTRMAA